MFCRSSIIPKDIAAYADSSPEAGSDSDCPNFLQPRRLEKI